MLKNLFTHKIVDTSSLKLKLLTCSDQEQCFEMMQAKAISMLVGSAFGYYVSGAMGALVGFGSGLLDTQAFAFLGGSLGYAKDKNIIQGAIFGTTAEIIYGFIHDTSNSIYDYYNCITIEHI